jgi:rubredoxin-NAD+ reductase
VLVIGGGLIGCEFANDLVQAGYAVHVVDPASGPLAALLPVAAAEQLRQALQDVGVVWHWGVTVQTLEAANGAHRYVGTLSDGTSVAADAVLSAVGLRADTTLAAQAGLACGRGVLVDAQLQTSAPGVYALGDCAQYASAGGRTLPYVMPIMHAARALAATLAGTPTDLVFPLMPVAVKTPALPITVAAPHPDLQGAWTQDPATDGLLEGGAWRFMDADGAQRGLERFGVVVDEDAGERAGQCAVWLPGRHCGHGRAARCDDLRLGRVWRGRHPGPHCGGGHHDAGRRGARLWGRVNKLLRSSSARV